MEPVIRREGNLMSKEMTPLKLPSTVGELIRLIENDEVVSINGSSDMDKKELFEMVLQMKADEAANQIKQEISEFHQNLLEKISSL